jgi:tetratricopeptide (TPR) repeat protein
MRLTSIPILFLLSSIAAFAQQDPPAPQPEPRTAEEFYARAQRLLRHSQTEPAIDDLTSSLNLQPDFHEALLLRASAYATLKRFPAAIADLDALLRIEPRSSAFVFRGNLMMASDLYELALADFSEAITRDPGNSAAYQLRATLRDKLGDSGGAAADRSKVAELAATRGDPTSLAGTGSGAAVTNNVPLKIGGGVSAPKLLSQKEPN